MKLSAMLLSVFVITGCNYDSRKDELLGIWISNKAKTKSSMAEGKEMPEDLRIFLENNLGTMAYIFRPDETTFADVRTLSEVQEYASWNIYNINESEVTITFKRGFMNSVDVVFSRDASCLGTYNEAYDFTEYFCKTTHNKNSQQDAATDAAPLL